MFTNIPLALNLTLSITVAFLISFAATPLVKKFAEKVGAIDVPKDARRVHDHPIPRMGGLAIFLGFLISVVLFVKIDTKLQGVLLGAVVIVIVGIIDDITPLKAWLKFLFQILAAVISVLHGVTIQLLSNPIISGEAHLILGYLSIPVTVIWIVAVTNSVNLIDGLDGLAAGVSTISAVTLVVIALVASEGSIAVIMAALAGACLGFLPYNFNPAKIFMGDTGALLLGYVLSTVSVIGFFKFYAFITVLIPLLAMAVPIIDTTVSFFRRLLTGKNPMQADRGHFHHKLIDMGLSQKQAVAIIYLLSAIMGLIAVIFATNGIFKYAMLIITALLAVILIVVIKRMHIRKNKITGKMTVKPESPEEKRAEEDTGTDK